MKDTTIILIGGAPCVGKSALVQYVSSTFRIPWISTDIIRSFMKSVVHDGEYPNLSIFDEITAQEYLSTHNPETIVADQNKESADVWKGVVRFIESNTEWKSYIVEGVAVLPSLCAQLQRVNKRIQSLFIGSPGEQEIRKRIFARGLWDVASTYPDSVKDREVQWVAVFDAWLQKEAKRYNFSFISGGDREDMYEKVVEWFKHTV